MLHFLRKLVFIFAAVSFFISRVFAEDFSGSYFCQDSSDVEYTVMIEGCHISYTPLISGFGEVSYGKIREWGSQDRDISEEFETQQKWDSSRKGDIVFLEGPLNLRCLKALDEPESQENHSQNRSIQCPYPSCDKRFETVSGLFKHRLIHGKSFGCPHCARKFADSDSLNTHVANHRKKRFACTECPKTFSRMQHLDMHLLSHTGERPHVCTYAGCSKRFAFPNDLTRHLRTHTGERPFTCSRPGCTKAFKRKDHLEYHLSSHSRKGT